jgi:nucleotide-binding universal stress UspA family protein
MMPPKLILSPIDFSDPSLAALNVAADMAARLDAELLLVHVVPAIPELPAGVSILKEGEYDDRLSATAREQLSELAASLPKIKVRTEIGAADEVGMELIRIAERNHVDMIVLATHGMTGWREFAFGSVAEKVVKEADCPVLVLRAKATEDADREDEPLSSSASA